MPLPRVMARFNKVVTNRLFGLVAHRLRPWAVIHHVGRKSGREYATVVWAFRVGDSLAVALTYGRGSDWARNVLAAGECEVERRGRWVEMGEPRVESGARRKVPLVLRPALWLLRVDEMLVLSPAEGQVVR